MKIRIRITLSAQLAYVEVELTLDQLIPTPRTDHPVGKLLIGRATRFFGRGNGLVALQVVVDTLVFVARILSRRQASQPGLDGMHDAIQKVLAKSPEIQIMQGGVNGSTGI